MHLEENRSYFGTDSLFFDLPFQTHTENNYRGHNGEGRNPPNPLG